MKHTKRSNKLTKFNYTISFLIKQVKYPINKEILLLLAPKESKLEFFLVN